jgi:hypothetical protein
MLARLTRYEGGDPSKVDEAVEHKKNVLPTEPGQVEGMRGAIFFADRSNGTILTLSLWEDEESLAASEEMANQLREELTAEGETATVETYEVAQLSITQP